MKKNIQKIKRNGGQAMLISIIFFLFISLAIIGGLVGPTVKEYKIANDLIRSKQSFALSEAGVEDAYYRLREGWPIGDSTTISLNGNTTETTIEDFGSNQKTIISVGDVSERQRTNNLIINTGGTGVAFSYGVQVGTGGITMGNNSTIQGSVYSNGPITGDGNIQGSATSANSSALTENQSNGSGVPAYGITFANNSTNEDFAQSFQVSTTDVLNKVQFYIKKISTPSSCTVRIMTNSSGSPSSTTLTSGTLSNTAVSTTYGWVEVTFTTNYELQSGTTYWLVIDCANSSTKYYIIGANNNGYANGTGKIGKRGGTWNNTSPSGLDEFFKVYLGGVTGFIDGINIGSNGAGDAWAHTVDNSSAVGTKYCTSTDNSPACNTSRGDAPPIAMPISDQNILDWKAEAEAGGTHTGDYTVYDDTESLGAKKITGNLTLENNADFTVTGTLWVQGDFTADNNVNVFLSPSYGEDDGVIIVDGEVTISNNADFSGSGVAGSYIMVLSTSTSTQAIDLQNNGGAVILYAANGTVNLSNNGGAKALNGKYINLSNNVTITYESGLVNSTFVNGPSGSWGISSWQEVE